MKDVQGQFHNQVSPGWIEIGSGENSVYHLLQAGVRQGIHAKKRNVFRFSQGPARAHSHPVVLAENRVRADALLHQTRHCPVSVFFQPVTVRGCQQLHPWMLRERFHKASVPVIGRGRTGQPLDFHYLSFPSQEVGHEAAHHSAYFYIIGPDEGRIFVRVDFPVKEDDRDSGVKGLFHGTGDGAGLVGRHHQQVHAIPHKIPYLLHLTPAVVIG